MDIIAAKTGKSNGWTNYNVQVIGEDSGISMVVKDGKESRITSTSEDHGWDFLTNVKETLVSGQFLPLSDIRGLSLYRVEFDSRYDGLETWGSRTVFYLKNTKGLCCRLVLEYDKSEFTLLVPVGCISEYKGILSKISKTNLDTDKPVKVLEANIDKDGERVYSRGRLLDVFNK